jgi:flagellar P-ring protein precursor FlgI
MKTSLVCLALISSLLLGSVTFANTKLSSICHVKGQEENTISGWGLVVGLKGTGDSAEYGPMISALGNALVKMGAVSGATLNAKALKDTKNVALVWVSCTIPAGGARQGDHLHCKISSIGSCKSLVGGTLFLTPMQGPAPNGNHGIPGKLDSPTGAGLNKVYGFATGQVHVADEKKSPTTGTVFEGCQLESEFRNQFFAVNKRGEIVVTLVLDSDHASFKVAQEVADAVNSETLGTTDSRIGSDQLQSSVARALDQLNVEVIIPEYEQDNPVGFISRILEKAITDPSVKAGRVVVNEHTGSIVIDGEVEIGPVVVTHPNIVVSTDPTAAGHFVPITSEGVANTRLKDLVNLLNNVHVKPEDMIDILKDLKRSGKLHGTIVFE